MFVPLAKGGSAELSNYHFSVTSAQRRYSPPPSQARATCNAVNHEL
jgi:hypothetical protein